MKKITKILRSVVSTVLSIYMIGYSVYADEYPVEKSTQDVGKFAISALAKADIIKKDIKAEIEKPPTRLILPVQNIQQLPELPAGCEITATTIALNYSLGIKEDKMNMLQYMPIMRYPDQNGLWESPWNCFVGDPKLTYYGAYSPVIKKTLENYFKANKLDFKVTDLSGSSVKELTQYIAKGYPIIVWGTIRMSPVKTGRSWYLQDGSKFTWTSGEHCLVLIGYDLEKQTVILSDPYDSRGTLEYDWSVFEKRYEELYQQALIIERN